MSVLSSIFESIQHTLQRTEPDVWVAQINGQPLHVREIRLASDISEQKPPLIIGLHGYGIDEMQMKTLVNIQLDQPFVYLAPRAPHIHPTGGYAWFPINVMDGTFQVDSAEMRSSLDLIADLIPQAVKRYQADPAQVFVIGYSQGAVMSIAFMLTHPELIAGAAAMSGQLLDEVKAYAVPTMAQRKPFFLGYGTKDPLITLDDMRETTAFMAAHGIDVTYSEYPIPHVVSQAQLRDVEAWLTPLLS